VTDHRIIDSMAAIAREDFVPEQRRSVAYVDEDIEIAPGRYLIEAMAFAKLLQLAEIRPTDRVLHIGAGTGYGSAVIAPLALSVTALEGDPVLAGKAQSNLVSYPSVSVVEGPLDEGWPAAGPYDVIIIEGRVGEVPQGVLHQLADNGRLVAVAGEGDVSKAMIWTAQGGGFAKRPAFDASVSPLPGFARKRPAFVF
jgi:protein-L-isoaspartate(D-aspartate) O-methyltransferase